MSRLMIIVYIDNKSLIRQRYENSFPKQVKQNERRMNDLCNVKNYYVILFDNWGSRL